MDCGAQARPISGASDKTVRLWNINAETHLVFRGHKATVDAVRMLTTDTFLSGDQNGALMLWKETQKRPVAIVPAAHGIDGQDASAGALSASSLPQRLLEREAARGQNGVRAENGSHVAPEDSDDVDEVGGNRAPPNGSKDAVTASSSRASGNLGKYATNARWICSLSTLHMSDVAVSGSYDGFVRIWEARADERRLRPIRAVAVPGFINALAISQRDPRIIVAGTGNEHRLGRWWRLKGGGGEGGGLNKVVVLKLPVSEDDIEGGNGDHGEDPDDTGAGGGDVEDGDSDEDEDVEVTAEEESEEYE